MWNKITCYLVANKNKYYFSVTIIKSQSSVQFCFKNRTVSKTIEFCRSWLPTILDEISKNYLRPKILYYRFLLCEGKWKDWFIRWLAWKVIFLFNGLAVKFGRKKLPLKRKIIFLLYQPIRNLKIIRITNMQCNDLLFKRHLWSTTFY